MRRFSLVAAAALLASGVLLRPGLDAQVRPIYDMGAAGPTPPVRREAQRRIAADPELTTGMVRILNHELRPSEVFTPAFALTTTAQALRHGRGHRREVLREARAATVDELRRHAARRARMFVHLR